MFDYKNPKLPRFHEGSHIFTLRQNRANLVKRAGINAQMLSNEHSPEITVWLISGRISAMDSAMSESVIQAQEPSIASLLVKQSPSVHYGHGWIMGKDGKRWHPCSSQDSLLADLSTTLEGKPWLLKVLRRLFH